MTTKSPGKIHVTTTINGQEHELLVPPYMSLLDTLRELIGLTGTKEGCLDGNCGACTVSVDGRIVDSCLVLGAEVNGKNVDTVASTAGIPRRSSTSVRYLHTRLPRGSQGPARQRAFTNRRPNSTLASRKPLPMHWVRQDRTSSAKSK